MSRRKSKANRMIKKNTPVNSTEAIEKTVAVEAKKEPAVEVYVEYEASQIMTAEVVEKVKALYAEAGKNIADINSIKVYIKPEDNAAYYVINDDENGKIDL